MLLADAAGQGAGLLPEMARGGARRQASATTTRRPRYPAASLRQPDEGCGQLGRGLVESRISSFLLRTSELCIGADLSWRFWHSPPAPVEPEAVLVQVLLQVLEPGPALMSRQQSPLHQGCDPVNPQRQRADVLAFAARWLRRSWTTPVGGERPVAAPPVGDHSGPGLHSLGHEPAQYHGQDAGNH